MKVLVIGKAKTGTTALASLIRASLPDCALCMEPKSIFDVVKSGISQESGNAVIKIIFEHFANRARHLNAIAHSEFGFPIDKLVFIRRDVRDEMISRLMYFAKVMPKKADDEPRWARWVACLQAKEQKPASLSFKDLCGIFFDIFQVDVWKNIVEVNVQNGVEFESFIKSAIRRDHFTIDYRDLVSNNTNELGRYLGLRLSDQLESVDLGGFGYTRRSGSSDNWRAFFTHNDVATLRPIFDNLFGADRYVDWDLINCDKLPSSSYSEYVLRLRGQTDGQVSKLPGVGSSDLLSTKIGGKAPLSNAESGNIALGKRAVQSSVSARSFARDRNSDAGGGVDGQPDGTIGFHTDLEDSPWWMVDLGGTFGITEVRIFNRIDDPGIACRASRLVIEVGAAPDRLVEVYRRETDEPFGGIDGNPFVLKPGMPIPGRFVRVRLLTRNYLHLDQVEIYGEPLPWAGDGAGA